MILKLPELTKNPSLQQIRFTYHAFCRYLERVKKINIEAIKKELDGATEEQVLRYVYDVYQISFDSILNETLTPKIKNQIETLGSARIPIGNGITLVVENQIIVTIINKQES